MSENNFPERLLIIDIDGLRQDVFHNALANGSVPNLAELLGGAQAANGLHLDPVSTAPSITFCAQTSIFTGAHPDEHAIPGNQFFDRFGRRNGGKARFYAFDIGDTLAVDDAVLVFSGATGLLGDTANPALTTLYERAARRGLSSAVSHHMLARGADAWMRPDLVEIGRFTKGGGLLGISALEFDRKMVEKAVRHLQKGARPDVMTLYFMGVDHRSHEHGPEDQQAALADVDGLLGEFLSEYRKAGLLEGALAVVVSDHGQIRVIPDDRHSLRMSFPFDREMGYLFDALGLDVHDKPGEDPNCDAVVASNGGLAHVYLQHREGNWADMPRFQADVIRTGMAFWEANLTGQHAPDLQDALSMVLLRNAEAEGWEAVYSALTPEGRVVEVGEFLDAHPEIETVEAVQRLERLAGPLCGDLLLVSNYAGGFYFANPMPGMHGGLHPHDSLCVASLGWVGATDQQAKRLREDARVVVDTRCRAEGRVRASLTDLLPVLGKWIG
jgi:hypothetical protein